MLISDHLKVEIFLLASLTFVHSYHKQLQDHDQVGLLQKIEENGSVRPCNYASQSRSAAKQHSSLIICQSVGPLFDNVSYWCYWY